MIPKDIEAQVLRLYRAEKWRIGTIAKQLGLHHQTVRRVVREDGIADSALARRKSMADPFVPFIQATLEKWPTLTASRLFEMVRERGYPGRADHFRAIVARYRPRQAAEAFARLRTLPGEQAQVDWAHFGTIAIGNHERPLVAFVMILSWSRHVFVRFALDMRTGSFLRLHLEAFEAFGGVPRVLLYDNLKSVVIERRGDAIRFNENLLAFAGHYCYEPRPVAPYRGNEKGRVERAIRDIRDGFFAARTFADLDDLNAQATAWCNGPRAERRSPEDRTRTVRAMFDEERPRVLALPDDRFAADDRVDAVIGKTPYVRFDGNDYSVPHTRVRRIVTVVADAKTVRIVDGVDEIARHARCWAKGAQVEDDAHLAPLIEAKREAREGRGMDRLAHAAPTTRAFLIRVAERGGNLGSHTNGLLKLLDAFGAAELEAAVAEAVSKDTPHLHAVRQILDRHRHATGRPAPVAVALPDDPRVRGLVVKPHALDAYDRLSEDHDDA